MTYQFKEGDKGFCRDGVTKYEVLRVLVDGYLAVVLTFFVSRNQAVRNFRPTGEDYLNKSYDLTPPKRTVEFWVDVYADGTVGMQIPHTAKKVVACKPVCLEYTDGEGL